MLVWVPQVSLNEYVLVGLQGNSRFYRMKSKHHKVFLLLTKVSTKPQFLIQIKQKRVAFI